MILNLPTQGWRAVGVILLMLLLSSCSQPAQAPAAPTAAPQVVAPTTAAPTAVPPTTAPATAAPKPAPTTTTAPTVAPTVVAKKLSIVATTTIIGDLAKNVIGTAADLVVLVPAGADPHTFEPAPRDSQALARADVLLENGIGLEEWLDKLITNSGTKAKSVVVSKDLKLREAEDDNHHATEVMAEDHGHDEKKDEAKKDEPKKADDHAHAFDPHLWLDVQAAIKYVENIRDGLSALDSANAATYKTNAEKYLAQLKELDAYVTQQANSIPKERRKLVTSHDTFGYFAERYGFEIIGTIIPSVSAEAQPSAKDVADLITAIKATQAPAVFTESTVNPRLAEQIAKDASVKVVTDLYTDSLSEAGKAADTYLKMMRYNIDQIVKALK